jgi:hypothetical protein
MAPRKRRETSPRQQIREAPSSDGQIGDAIVSDRPTPEDFRANVFEDRETPGSWRVEKMDEDGGYEVVKVFSGSLAQRRALSYAAREFGEYDVIWLKPYWV